MEIVVVVIFVRASLLILVGVPVDRICQFFDRKVSNSRSIAHFYSEKLADSSLRKTNHELLEVPDSNKVNLTP